MDGVTVTINGADVIINSSAKKVCYNVSGTTTNGFLKIYSDNKFELNLNGVNITNPDGAAINIQSKKRGYIVLADGKKQSEIYKNDELYQLIALSSVRSFSFA